MQSNNLSIVSKKIIVTRIICFFWLIAKVMSWKVWLAERLFPIVPPFNFLFVPSVVHLVLFIFSLVTLLALFIFPSKKLLLISVIVIEILSCVLDQNRWQAWEYQYIFITLALVINYKNERNAISSILFIFITVYIFSGIGKMNPVFSQGIQNEMAHSGIFHESNSYLYNLLIYHTGYFTGIIEVLSGVGLLFRGTKKNSALLLILMHIIIIVLFGPWAINYDVTILPWNFAFILILYVFFIRNPAVSINFQVLKKGWNLLFIVFFGLLPILNFFGYWDFFLSSSLFSYKPPDMYVYIHKQGSSKVLQPFFTHTKTNFFKDSNTVLLNIRAWSFQEMQSPAYPEIRVYKKIKAQLLQRYPDIDATFIVLKYINGRKERIELK